MKTKSNNYI